MMTDKQQAAAFEALMEAVTDKLFEQYGGDAAKLTAQEQEITAIWRAETDIYNGGLIQFYCNWGEDGFRAACAAFEKIGAANSLNLLHRFKQLIADLHHDRRWDISQYLTKAQIEKLDALDEQYWEDPDNILQLCYRHYCIKAA
ncbi:MAG: DUF4375 domain-containing protein [Neisseria sp.]|nr:DUF4375 domain-containing protein [Neisseria sp.]